MAQHRPPMDEFLRPFEVTAGHPVHLAKDHDPAYKPDWLDKEEGEAWLKEGIDRLAEYQDKLFAQNIHGLLVVLQALDAAGKDGTVKHVMSGINPMGCQVYSFKVPSAEEMDHDYLWRSFKALPERGRIGLFNRSYYEDVLVVRVHPEILARAQLPMAAKEDPGIWHDRFEQINHFEKYLVANCIHVVKIFLNVSKDEQRKRFLERIDNPAKRWKFAEADVAERARWADYMHAYEEVLQHTSTSWAPWYVVPADRKWFARVVVAEIIGRKMQELAPAFPEPTPEQLAGLERARASLVGEG